MHILHHFFFCRIEMVLSALLSQFLLFCLLLWMFAFMNLKDMTASIYHLFLFFMIFCYRNRTPGPYAAKTCPLTLAEPVPALFSFLWLVCLARLDFLSLNFLVYFLIFLVYFSADFSPQTSFSLKSHIPTKHFLH